MNLVIDIGNSRVRVGRYGVAGAFAERVAERFSAAVLGELTAAFPVRGAIVSLYPGRCRRCRRRRSGTGDSLLGVHSADARAHRQRLPHAPYVGARQARRRGRVTVLWPGRDVLVVDCGTAVTIDLVTADGTFRGGSISPGLRMRFRALHEFTAALPLCEVPDSDGLFGRSTSGAIGAGVLNSLVFEIEGYIGRLRRQIDGLCVIFTGGDAKYLTKRIKMRYLQIVIRSFADWTEF